MMMRSTGVLMPVSSLPSPHGIGTLGKDAERFIDFLAESGMTYWQILPLGPTGYGNSPYAPVSSYAGNPYFIDLDELVEEGLLTEEEVKGVDFGKNASKVDYGKLYNNRYTVLKKACDRLCAVHPEEYLSFLREQSGWLKDYAVFMAVKNDRNGEPWMKWPEELRNPHNEAFRKEGERLSSAVVFQERMQYLFYRQLKHIKEYAKASGIQIIGDLPFYCAEDSVDVFAAQEQFDLKYTAGMPDGQKWGSPVFNWDVMRNQGYRWWIDRVKFQMQFSDVVRVDHFQGYDSFYAIEKEGDQGSWRQGPGLELFKRLEQEAGWHQLILEDLGVLTDSLKNLVKESGFPGMRILQYAFDPNDPGSYYMPFQYEKNTVVYTGTHDNMTLGEWMKKEPARVERASAYLNSDARHLPESMIKCALGSPADLAVIPMADLLGLKEEGRINDPAGSDNWTFRVKPGVLTEELASKLKEWNLLYCRNNWNASVQVVKK